MDLTSASYINLPFLIGVTIVCPRLALTRLSRLFYNARTGCNFS